MTDPQFTVGQRAYWIWTETSRWPPYAIRYLYSGMVMSTGDAVTQVWNDNPADHREHHPLTFANDKIWPDRETPARIIRDRNREEAELAAEADRIIAEDEAKKATDGGDGGECVPEHSQRRSRWKRS